MDLRLAGRVVVVTGGTSGIGLATCHQLVDEGARVATCGRNQDRIDALAQSIGADRLFVTACDVRDRHQVMGFVADIVERFGRIDGLVNNAGQSRMKPFDDTTWQDWSDEIELKFASILHPVNACLPHLRTTDAGAIVNINAVLARQPDQRLITTSAARAGVLNLSKSLANEFAPDGIRVNSVCLGLIDSGQWRRRYAEADTDASWGKWSTELARDRNIPLARLGEPDEVASVVCFLLSPRAGYVTGAAVDVGGGIGRYV